VSSSQKLTDTRLILENHSAMSEQLAMLRFFKRVIVSVSPTSYALRVRLVNNFLGE